MEKENLSDEGFCEIRVKGRLEARWAEWFDLMQIESESDLTIISGFVADQPALQGLMQKISMLGLTIVSVKYNGSL